MLDFSHEDGINDDTLFWLEPFWADGFGATTRFRASQFRKNRGKRFTNQKLLLGFWRTRTRRFLPWRVARKRRRSPKERQVSQLLCRQNKKKYKVTCQQKASIIGSIISWKYCYVGCFSEKLLLWTFGPFFFLCCFKRPGHLGAQNPRNAIWFRDFCSNFREVQTHCESQAAVLPAQEVICLDNFSNQTTSSDRSHQILENLLDEVGFSRGFLFLWLGLQPQKITVPYRAVFFTAGWIRAKFPKIPQLHPKKNTISWKVNFCPVFPGNSSTGGLRISPSFFFVCAVFDRKNYTKGKDLEDICLDLGWLGWRKKGLGGGWGVGEMWSMECQ